MYGIYFQSNVFVKIMENHEVMLYLLLPPILRNPNSVAS